ncbi:hypothetical protein GEMRC1_002033 [Eukaryota sp. GEM-RC1]
MAKRKSSTALPSKKTQVKMPRRFDCPFCESSSSCVTSVKRDSAHRQRGIIECTQCQANWNVVMTPLMAPIDIYYSWLDAAQEQQPVREAPRLIQQTARSRDSESVSIDVSQEPDLPKDDESSDEAFDEEKGLSDDESEAEDD